MGDGFTDFEGLSALVTGGASGIGAATAPLLAARGARVAVLDRAVGREGGGEVESGSWLALGADVTDDASVRAAVPAAADAFGGIDVLVNNAGIGAIGTIEDNDDAQWRSVFDVNVFGMVRVARAALPHLPRSGHAAIVNTCSIAATAAPPAPPPAPPPTGGGP